MKLIKLFTVAFIGYCVFNNLPVNASETLIGYSISDTIIAFPSESEGTVYRWAPLAVVIHSIEIDGNPLAPRATDVDFHRFDSSSVSIKDGGLVYLASSQNITSIIEYNSSSGVYRAIAYRLPVSFKSVVISYSLRFPSGKRSLVKKLHILPEDEMHPRG